MGTNLAPILANICINSNVKRRTMYYMYTEKYHMAWNVKIINDGFGIIKKQQKIIF
jgi:hypothetical protein